MQLHQATQWQLDMHEARKARLARMAIKPKPVVVLPAPVVLAAKPFISECWIDITSWPPHPQAKKRERAPYPSIDFIQRATCRYFNVTKNDLISQRRDWRIVRPRMIAMYVAKTLTPRSYPEIARRFDGRDHTTALSAVRRIEELRHTHAVIQTAVDEITARCLEHIQ